MQKVFDRAQRNGKGKPVDTVMKALERELKSVGINGVGKSDLESWAQQISEGVRLRAK